MTTTNVMNTVDNHNCISKPMIGHKIRAAREARGWSQADLARKVGVSQVAINKIENGDTAELRLGCRVLQVSQTPKPIDPIIKASLAGDIEPKTAAPEVRHGR